MLLHKCAAILLCAGLSLVATNTLATPGDLDRDFAAGAGRITTAIGSGNDFGRAVAVQSDGKIVVAGYAGNGSNFDFALARYNQDGSLDTNFGNAGKTTTPVGAGDDGAFAVAVQPDGKIVLAGYTYNGSNWDIALLRYNGDGSLDADFDGESGTGNGIVTTDLGVGNDYGLAVALQNDGKILVGGYAATGISFDFVLVRYNSDGTQDSDFDGDSGTGNGIVTTDVGGANDGGFALALQGDGKILLGGYSYIGATSDFSLLRYNSDGTLDTTFDTDGKVITAVSGDNDEAYSVTVQPDGKILLAGSATVGGNWDFAAVRYNADGSLDTDFDSDGIRTLALGVGQDYAYGIAVQTDGKIVMAGYSTSQGGLFNFAAARLNDDGSLDSAFDGDNGSGNGIVFTDIAGNEDRAFGIALQSDGKILVPGYAWSGSNYDFAVLRYSVNYDPTIVSTAVTSVDEDSPYYYTVSAEDVESGSLSITATTLPAWLTLADHGDGTATLTGTPANDDVGSHSVALRVSDGVDTGDQNFTITVHNVNDAPVVTSTALATATEDSQYAYTFTANDVDLGDSLTLSAPTLPSWMNFDAATGVLSGMPTNDEVGEYPVVLRVTDGDVDVDQAFTLTVLNTNDEPVITTTPASLGVAEDTPYTYVFAASDVDVGDHLTLSAPLLPAWLTFDPATGVLSGTPDNAAVGMHAVRLRAADGTVNVEQEFAIAVSNVNDAPTDILLAPASVAENTDTTSAVPVGTLSAVDVDVGDNHSFTISGGADAGHFELDGAVLRVAPGVALDRETKAVYEVEITTTDASTASFAKLLSIGVSNINEAPTLSDIDDQTIDIDGTSDVIALTVFDIDTAVDTLSLSLSADNERLIPQEGVTFAGEGADRTLTLRPGSLQYGATTVTVTVSDGELTASKRFAVSVTGVDSDGDTIPDAVDTDDDDDGMSDAFEQAYGLDPLNASDAMLDSDGDGLTNLDEYTSQRNPRVDDNPPVVTPPPTVTFAASGLFTEVALGQASALDAVDGALPATAEHNGPFEPGAHRVTWTATDAAGNRGTAQQTVNVLPLASFAPDQFTGEGGAVTVRIVLNGDAPVYPVTIPYTVSGSATYPDDHDLVAGQFTLAAGREANIVFNVHGDALREPTAETVVLTMTSPTGVVAGRRSQHRVSIVEENLAPKVKLSLWQSGRNTNVIVANDSAVTVNTSVEDGNPSDLHSYDWSGSDNALTPPLTSSPSFTIDPRELVPGTYRVRVAVTDNGTPPATTTVATAFRVIAAAPALSATQDLDGDGLSDAEEGFGDADGDGIADYEDAVDASNVLQGRAYTVDDYLLETTPGLTLRLGTAAFVAGATAATLTTQQIASANATRSDSLANVGGYFDFEIGDLSKPGETAQIVLPQLAAIPSNPVYRKLLGSGWTDFLQNSRNGLASAAGEPGYCPPPGDEAYTPGLTPGHWCVQLTLDDGGPNDADGLANGVIADPGGIAERSASGSGGGGAIALWLATLLLASCWRRRGAAQHNATP